jgi:fructose-bisphosphate aldolase class II
METKRGVKMLVNMKDLLVKARKGGYAVPAFDTDVNVLMKATLDTAEMMRSPVILQFHESDIQGRNGYYVIAAVTGIAERYDIPIVLHLDHGSNINAIKRAVDLGFTSVMFDGSHLPVELNIEKTRNVVEYAHERAVSVEAELGHVGGSDRNFEDTGASELTDPEDVGRFVDATGVDALAVSIGTSHGVYTAEPKLNIDVLKAISSASELPLVLHGGSANPPEQLKEAVSNGISKINIFADLRVAFKQGLDEAAASIMREDPMPKELFEPLSRHISMVVAEKIGLCGSGQKA